MNNKLEIKDEFKATDKLKGIVTIMKDGKVILKKHNMITNDGRELLFNLFTQEIFNTENKIGIYYLDLCLGTSNTVNSSSYLSASFEPVDNLKVVFINKDETNGVSIIKDGEIKTGNNTLSIKENRTIELSCEIKGETENLINEIKELGIRFKTYNFKLPGESIEGPISAEKVFSRLNFDPQVLGPGSSFNITYTIYF